jgi:ABC-type sugar transport system ATPase subunit
MYVRLAFATAVQVNADILLIDEVLAVGDAAFQQKCFDEFTRLREAGRTLLFVTHDMGAVERFCDRAMLLERGRVVDIGQPSAIARQYNQINFQRIRQAAAQDAPNEEGAHADHVAEVVSAWFESPAGEIISTINQGEQCVICMDVGFVGTVGRFEPGTTASIRITFQNVLAPARYRLIATVSRAGLGADVYDTNVTGSIIVMPDRPGGGMADLPNSFELTRE